MFTCQKKAPHLIDRSAHLAKIFPWCRVGSGSAWVYGLSLNKLKLNNLKKYVALYFGYTPRPRIIKQTLNLRQTMSNLVKQQNNFITVFSGSSLPLLRDDWCSLSSLKVLPAKFLNFKHFMLKWILILYMIGFLNSLMSSARQPIKGWETLVYAIPSSMFTIWNLSTKENYPFFLLLTLNLGN